jgi:uncharacterized protein
MRSADCDILMVPGLGGSGPDHWQSRWEGRLSTASRVEQADWERPERAAWTAAVAEAVSRATRPVVLVAHSLGAVTCAHAAPALPPGRVRGAFLVAPPDVDDPMMAEAERVRGFAPLPMHVLSFPALLVASRDNPYCAYARSEEVARAWGATLVDAGMSGHINAASGHGPWPEGLMRFAGFLKTLEA